MKCEEEPHTQHHNQQPPQGRQPSPDETNNQPRKMSGFHGAAQDPHIYSGEDQPTYQRQQTPAAAQRRLLPYILLQPTYQRQRTPAAAQRRFYTIHSVVHTSGVPVPGANAGSATSMSRLRYTGPVPTLFLILSATQSKPWSSSSEQKIVFMPWWATGLEGAAKNSVHGGVY